MSVGLAPCLPVPAWLVPGRLYAAPPHASLQRTFHWRLHFSASQHHPPSNNNCRQEVPRRRAAPGGGSNIVPTEGTLTERRKRQVGESLMPTLLTAALLTAAC